MPRDCDPGSDLQCDLGQVPVPFWGSVSHPLFKEWLDYVSHKMSRHEIAGIRGMVGQGQSLRAWPWMRADSAFLLSVLHYPVLALVTSRG